MKLQWILLAEGLGQDSRGAITAIAINTNVFSPAALPATTKRAIVMRLIDENDEVQVGQLFNFRISFIGPSGDVLSAQPGQGVLGPPFWPNLPKALDLPAELILNCTEYGTHRIEVSVQFGKVEIKENVDIYVVDSKDSLQSLQVTDSH